MAWPPFSGGPRSVDTQVLTLRRKLEQAGLGEGGGIETVRQQGYRFSLDTIPADSGAGDVARAVVPIGS
jgi:DNA-binding response OmpR family regulator